MPIVRPEDVAFLQTTRRAVLATITPNGQPRQVPICFAIVEGGDGAIIYSPLDEKPKRGAPIRTSSPASGISSSDRA
jgi:hypothetical protein